MNKDNNIWGLVVLAVIGGIVYLAWHNHNYHQSNDYQQQQCIELAYATMNATSPKASFYNQRAQLLQSDVATCKQYWPTQ